MAKKLDFRCQSCGASYPKWIGRCDQCQAWNTIIQELSNHDLTKSSLSLTNPLQTIVLNEMGGTLSSINRIYCGLGEFDRVCGGGVTAGACIVLGGDPGIGKSTMTLQVAGLLSYHHCVWYISGEESCDQVYQRACRLGLGEAGLRLASHTQIESIITALDQGSKDFKDPAAGPNPVCVVIDSIQTMYTSCIDAAPGTVSQVRYCALELVRVAKAKGIILILVGHVTKEGNLAGPRILEHMVDTVLYFEGDRQHDFRLLRCVKNRYGSTDEVGVFVMRANGLEEVTNPSSLFLSPTKESMTGSCVFAGIEGNRPIFCDVQALVALSCLPSPRRTTVGWDNNRLSTLLAVLEARGKFKFSNKDVYLNIAGGIRIDDPAIDLAVAAALVSALLNKPIEAARTFFGEVALSGAIRPSRLVEQRLKEALRLQYTSVVLSHAIPNLQDYQGSSKELQLIPLRHIGELINWLSSPLPQ